ncbi:DUF2271 domain-containing protein [Flavicella sp.]|uniref:DUF2271 domain-containing protein n=1 Tax=Flavicella sp. TaxID=2957742 RepID=UPI0026213D02|nr:DUF2271 domain-containing protein [Flavicella sp.]MDG1804750.1 DUF2271 domain-containing protein [Flavicella sp.]MDG2280716.1 DUF2271 domain-containing protein [Flavicella sp.]
MKLKILIAVTVVFSLLSFNKLVNTTSVKCMIQMKNYSGEAAYIVISLLDNENQYKKTLYVQGDDDEWFSEIPSWWKFYGKYRPNLDAISGATVGPGKRIVNKINIPKDAFGKGYKLRFETAVEDNSYYEQDIEIELTSMEGLNKKIEGAGYIRYVRMLTE